jgi:hypothetical protein
MGRRRREGAAATRKGWHAAIIAAVPVLYLIGLSARPSFHQDSQREPDGSSLRDAGPRSALHARSLPTALHPDAAINTAANQLFALVEQSIAEEGYMPRFARDKIEWLVAQQKAGALSITLLKNIAETNLDAEDLMASGRVDGRRVIVIARPRFVRFLVEGGRVSAPFSQQQRNDFMLGLVHETVHLQRSNPSNPADLEDRLNEELRAWREVDVNVVRQLRELNQPMNERFIEADDAIRSCGNEERCQPLREILLPSERGR